MNLSLITGPADEPLSTTEVKEYLRETSASQDRVIDTLIKAARRKVESITNRQLLEATWELWLDAFPCPYIDVPRPPLRSVESIKYLDTNGTEQTWAVADYRVSKPAGPYCARGRITPAYGESYPTTQQVIDAVKVQFKAGYGTDPDTVPEDLKEAMLLLISHWYENREAIVIGIGNLVTPVPLGVATLLAPFKTRPVLQMDAAQPAYA